MQKQIEGEEFQTLKSQNRKLAGNFSVHRSTKRHVLPVPTQSALPSFTGPEESTQAIGKAMNEPFAYTDFRQCLACCSLN